jgi:formylglycine-generating enzyme required for sulfatase activity
MPNKLPLLLILLCLAKLAVAQTPIREGSDHAVLFYVTDYQKPWQNLPNTKPEIEGIANDLRSIYGFTTDLQANKNSTQITDKLVELKKRSYGPNDQLLLFFSMHGHYSADAYSGCLVPAGGLGDDPAYRTWILHNSLKALVTQIPCEHILLVIDACYSGSFAGVKSQPDPPPGPTCADKIKTALQRKGRQYLCAGGNQKVPAVSDFANKWRIALGSRGGDDGILNYRELVMQVSDAEPNPTWGDFDGHLGGNFLFISKQACGGSSPTPPTDPEDNMVLVLGGTFQMGCTSEQQDCSSDEKPVHSVTLDDFYIGKYEVTQKFWQEIMKSNPSRFVDCDQCPVEQVSWDDVQSFLQKLNAKYPGRNYRLPTEAEWEYAAREGGKAVLLGNGKSLINPNEINFNASVDYKKPYSIAGTYCGKTIQVGSLNSPNALGLHDMSGNVWEWCSDWYSSDYYKNSPNGNPKGHDTGSGRVVRGGSWDDYPQDCRVAVRFSYAPGYRYFNLGFRLARTP